jgi:hypothetical protein
MRKFMIFSAKARALLDPIEMDADEAMLQLGCTEIVRYSRHWAFHLNSQSSARSGKPSLSYTFFISH